MIEKAVIDRIVDGRIAVIIVGEQETQYEYPAIKLPEGAREGSWLKVTMGDGLITDITLDQQETDKVYYRIQSKMDKLRSRGRKKI